MKAFYFALLLLCCNFCFAQNENRIRVQGIVKNVENYPIPEVFISVNWSKKGLLSRKDGSFYIEVSRQDTMVFKHTSFEPKAITLSAINTSDTLKIQLTERTLELDEVQVTNWGTWEDFKNKVKTMNSDSIRNTDIYRLKSMFDHIPPARHADQFNFRPPMTPAAAKGINPYGVNFIGGGGGINISLPIIKTEERKVKEKLQKNAHRYSDTILHKILKIDGDTLKNFKKYCDYLLDFKQNDLKLTQQINSLYDDWNAYNKTLQADSLTKTDIGYIPVSNTPFNSATSERKR